MENNKIKLGINELNIIVQALNKGTFSNIELYAINSALSKLEDILIKYNQALENGGYQKETQE